MTAHREVPLAIDMALNRNTDGAQKTEYSEPRGSPETTVRPNVSAIQQIDKPHRELWLRRLLSHIPGSIRDLN